MIIMGPVKVGKNRHVTPFYFCSFVERPSRDQPRKTTRAFCALLALRPLLADSSRALPFPSWGRLSENIPLEPRGKEKVRFFRSGSLTPAVSGQKRES